MLIVDRQSGTGHLHILSSTAWRRSALSLARRIADTDARWTPGRWLSSIPGLSLGFCCNSQIAVGQLTSRHSDASDDVIISKRKSILCEHNIVLIWALDAFLGSYWTTFCLPYCVLLFHLCNLRIIGLMTAASFSFCWRLWYQVWMWYFAQRMEHSEWYRRWTLFYFQCTCTITGSTWTTRMITVINSVNSQPSPHEGLQHDGQLLF